MTCKSDIPQQIRRRRDASRRCEPLDCGERDPLDCDHDQLTERGLRSYLLAMEHLRAAGFEPVVSPRVRAALANVTRFRRGAA